MLKNSSSKKQGFDYAKQRMTLLALKVEFNNDIILLRKKWGIPLEGFSNYGRILLWMERLEEDTILYWKSRKFSNKVAKASAVYKDENGNTPAIYNEIDEIFGVHNEFEEQMSKVANEAPCPAFDADIDYLTAKYSLPYSYRKVIERYLLSGNIDDALSHFNRNYIRIGTRMVKENGDSTRKLYLEIGPEATIKDMQRIWSQVKEKQKGLFGYRKGRKKSYDYLKDDKRLLELKNEGLTNEQIIERLRDEGYVTRENYSDIYKRISFLNKKIKET